MTTRRSFLAATLMAPLAAASRKPNILIFLADDLGWNDVGFHGSEIKTPNIDRIAARGKQLDRFYAFPLCSPARAALLTGRSPISMGIYAPFSPTQQSGLPLDEHLIAQSFRDAGYFTFITGKWHLGNSHVKYFPHNRGFDRFYGHTGPAVGYTTHQVAGGYDWQRNGKSVREEGYTTNLIANEVARLLQQRDKKKPVFGYVAFNAPHTPLEAPDENLAKYAHIADESRRIYAAMVDALDIAIGRILAVVDKQKMTRDTLVLFLSDNGGNVNAGANNGPLARGKGGVYEGGIRVPAAIHWPGVIEGGGKITQLMTMHDWFPTLAAAAGVKAGNTKPFYGENMWAAIRSGKPVARENVILGARGGYALFDGEWKLVRSAGAESPAELYRIEEDPEEKNNLAGKYPDVVKDLTAKLDRFPKGESLSGPVGPGGPGGAGRKKGDGKKGGGKKGPGGGAGGGVPSEDFNTKGPETRPPFAEAAAR